MAAVRAETNLNTDIVKTPHVFGLNLSALPFDVAAKDLTDCTCNDRKIERAPEEEEKKKTGQGHP